MAQQQQSITIAAPGFYGLNSQDSPVDQQPRFASTALNCIIDKYGRVGARKGYEYVTTTSTALAGAGLSAIYQYSKKADGVVVTLSAGNNKIFTGTTTLTDATPGSYTITANNWKIVELNEHVYFFQRSYEPLVYSEHTGTVEKMSAHDHAAGTPPQANEALAAFGKLWVADFATDKHTVYWSDTLDGSRWTGGTSGSIDLDTVWPNGNDEIVALAEHNGFLVIFGRRSIIIYSGADDPSTMLLSDSIQGIGCIARDSVQSTGADIIFLSEVGVQSLMRLVQEKSAPMRDISKNVRDELTGYVAVETGVIRSAFSAKEAFYLLSLPNNGFVYCFDMRGMLEDGSARTTVWDNIAPKCFHVNRAGVLLMGHANGITQYTGYQDNAGSYQMEYFSNAISFGQPSQLKFPKKIAFTIIGGSGATANIKWAYDYKLSFRTQQFVLNSSDISQYNIDEYNIGEYSTGIVVTRASVNTGGSGYVVTIGMTSTINGAALSIQQIDVLALLGRLI
jgi:hypothetical protein